MAERLRDDESYFIAAAIAGVTAYLKEYPDESREDITTQEVVVFSQEEQHPDKLPTRGTPISSWKGLGWTGREHPSAWKDVT